MMADASDKLRESPLLDERMREFGRHLRDLRKNARYSLEELATELRKRGVPKYGTSRQYLGALERGEVSNPSPELLHEIATALDAISSEFWLLAGLMPPGPEGEAYTDLIREAQRKGFSRMLEDKGLSDAMIRNVLSKVSDQTIDRVVRREEPLMIQASATVEEQAAHEAMGYEVHPVISDESVVRESAAEYIDSIEDAFAKAPSRRLATDSLDATRHDDKKRRTGGETIGAGRVARIFVNRPLNPDERDALEHVAKLIAHLLR